MLNCILHHKQGSHTSLSDRLIKTTTPPTPATTTATTTVREGGNEEREDPVVFERKLDVATADIYAPISAITYSPRSHERTLL